jgi:hypothetical protein
MRWYSMKKFKPFFGGEYFVTDGDFIYSAKYTVDGWIDTSTDEDPLGNITHFCRPDPMEIDE